MDVRVKDFLSLKKLNESLFISIDKSPNICYISKKDYDKKLSDIFDTENFEKLPNFKIVTELEAFRKIPTETLGRNVSNLKMLNLHPKNSISEAFGTIKMHKDGFPLRVVSYDPSYLLILV